MTRDFIPFAKPDIGDAEIAAVTDVLKSGWITTGQKSSEFEKRFEALLGQGINAIAVNSATAGLHLALEAIGIGPGDEVILPTLTFTATAEVVRYLGGDPVLVDVDSGTLNLSPERVREAITPRTRAILPVHYAGLSCDMTAILAIAAEFGLRVVEDAAHALPATHAGRMIGALDSDVTVFSFYANKTMTTGEGGMVVTRDPELAKRMRVMRLHGIDRDAFDRFRSHVPAWYYEVIAPGFKYNLTDIAAALGLVQLDRLGSFQDRRVRLAARYYETLADLPLILPSWGSEDGQHAWHLFVLRLDDEALQRGHTRDALIDHLSAAGIGTSVHYVPLHRQPYWRDSLGARAEDFPVAEKAYQSMVSIPLFTAMSDDDQEHIIGALRAFFA
ncbi:MAG TPA: DegT/DnrJ/EryC1/StrS family aminotransferase [Terriglobales bacterium]|nr:DegT/DnrJ/EryC1/StrS family aminotransferase [Terriglobales bacterium]